MIERVIPTYNALVRAYGADWIHWLVDTLAQHVVFDNHESLQSLRSTLAVRLMDDDSLTTENRDLLAALQLAAGTDRPWQEWDTFDRVGTAFCGRAISPGHAAPLHPAECILTMKLLGVLRKDETWGEEVLAYVAASFAHEGFVTLGEESRDKWGIRAPLMRMLADEDQRETARGVEKAFPAAWNHRDQILWNDDEVNPVAAQLHRLVELWKIIAESGGSL